MYLSENLKYLRKSHKKFGKLSQEGLAKHLNVTRSAISSYEDGRAEPKLDTLNRMSDFFDLSIDTLLNKDVSLLTEEELAHYEDQQKHVKGENIRILTLTVDESDEEHINLVPEKAAAGYMKGYSDATYLKELPRYQLPFLPKSKSYRAFEVSGDSMLPITNKSIVIGEFVQNWNELKDGYTCVVISKSDGIVLKKIYNRIEDRSTLLCKSTNLAYSPFEIKVDDVLEVWRFSALITKDVPQESTSIEDLKEVVLRLEEEVMTIKR